MSKIPLLSSDSKLGLQSLNKLHLPQNRETLVAVGVGVGLLFLVFVHLFVLIPKLVMVLKGTPTTPVTQAIDTAAINQAIEYLTETQ